MRRDSVIFSGLAQEKKAGRYESFKLKAGTETVDELLARARKLKETDRAGALNNIEEALGISLTAGNALDEGKCYLLLGEINVSIDEWKLALDALDAGRPA